MYINNYRMREFGVLVRFSLPEVNFNRQSAVIKIKWTRSYQ